MVNAMRNLDGLTVLFAHPMAELYGSDRVLLESVLGVLETGGRAVVVLPESGPLEQVLRDAVQLCVIVPRRCCARAACGRAAC